MPVNILKEHLILHIQYSGLDISGAYFDQSLPGSLGGASQWIFAQASGIVGDIINLPIKERSFALIICADVLEHISHPDRAFREIARILIDDGQALVVLPSMYKLDIADFQHIPDKRKSTHENRLAISDWQKLWETAGLEIDLNQSRPLGLGSGLSYLAWLEDEYVPARQTLAGEETYSEKSRQHKEAKDVLCRYDSQIDQAILTDSAIAQLLVEAMKKADFRTIFQELRQITDSLALDKDERQILASFFSSVAKIKFTDQRVAKLKRQFEQSANPLLLMGNSLLIVLKKIISAEH